ncbi:MAG: hypothetical protein HUJ70_11130 [Pseudobutyrivibrio sp.]|nr:hypothetical protein [Pseudobutyrivibrio sp.]
MIVTTDQLIFENKMYKDPKHRILNMSRKGEIIPIKRGLYETDRSVPGYLLANTMLGPSYISFEYALSYYGMIPERVVAYTSATFGKKKMLEFKNEFGTYRYRDVPVRVFPFYYSRELIDDRPLLIATKEKALCDTLSVISPIRGLSDFRDYLFDGMRLDEDEFYSLDMTKILRIAPLYHRTNLDQIVKLIEKV